jgi:hypothetical protein
MINIPYLDAVTFLKMIESGRTNPCVFICEDKSGNTAGEYVVKLRGSREIRENSFVFELYASFLGKYFELNVPDPAIVSIQSEFFDSIENLKIKELIQNSDGLNFGSKYLSGGFTIWPMDMEVPADLLDKSFKIFVYDMVIQNPDRKVINPNILWKGRNIYIIDHESAFSFIYGILPPKPWEIDKLDIFRDHIFYQSLRHKDLNFEWIREPFSQINSSVLDSIADVITEEWKTESIEKIKIHLIELKKHIDEFILSLRRVLV